MTIYLNTVYACAQQHQKLIIQRRERVSSSQYVPHRTSLHHWQRFFMNCFQLIFAILCKIISTFNRSQTVLIGDDYTMETSVMISFYRSSKNITTMATDKLIILLVDNHYNRVMFLRQQKQKLDNFSFLCILGNTYKA